jgi:hypothetical protein
MQIVIRHFLTKLFKFLKLLFNYELLHENVELHILLLPTCEKLPNIFIQVFLFTSMLRSKKTLFSAFAHAIIFLLFFAPWTFSHYSSASSDILTAPTEDIDSEDISALIQSTTQHVNETEKAIESGNSTVALELLAQIRTDLKNINGNITDLIFSVSETPP